MVRRAVHPDLRHRRRWFDHESFGNAGIPSSGFSTGISDCIHEACDDLANVDPKTETTSADAIVGVLWKLAATTPRH